MWSRSLQRDNRGFCVRLAGGGVLVLVGNVVRNTVLVAAQAAGAALPPWGHEAVGLVVLALVCGAIAWVMAGARPNWSDAA
ncbi:MAG: hypothetical protein IPO19_15135 [Rhodoferax sp.]|nr:hypothetical protein [Rhodoferax sp.]